MALYRKYFIVFISFFLAATGLIFIHSLDAYGRTKSRPKKQEVYSATDTSTYDSEAVAADEVLVQEESEALPPVESIEIETKTQKTTSKKIKKKSRAKQAETVAQTDIIVEDNYDPVPSDQTRLIAKRLILVQKLLMKHGRAYDYRTMTIAQLKDILAQLEQDQKQ